MQNPSPVVSFREKPQKRPEKNGSRPRRKPSSLADGPRGALYLVGLRDRSADKKTQLPAEANQRADAQIVLVQDDYWSHGWVNTKTPFASGENTTFSFSVSLAARCFD